MLGVNTKYFLTFFLLFILYVWVLCLHVYMCTVCMPHTYRGQKRPLELQMVWNGLVLGVESIHPSRPALSVSY